MILTTMEISKENHESRAVKIANHATSCYAQSRPSRLIWAWSRITLIGLITRHGKPLCHVFFHSYSLPYVQTKGSLFVQPFDFSVRAVGSGGESSDWPRDVMCIWDVTSITWKANTVLSVKFEKSARVWRSPRPRQPNIKIVAEIKWV